MATSEIRRATGIVDFRQTGWKVRATMRDGEPWFVAKDVCDCLGLDNVAKALSGLDNDEKASLQSITSSECPNDFKDLRKDTRIVSESGLYALIFKSRKPEAQEFRRWIRKEVLPEIRKTGAYLGGGQGPALVSGQLELELDGMKERLSLMEARSDLLLKKIERDRPYLAQGRQYEHLKGYMSMNEAAVFISQNVPIIQTGGKRLFAWLREHGFVGKGRDRRRLPTQKGIRSGFLIQKVRVYRDKRGHELRRETTYINESGALWVAGQMLNEANALIF